MQIFDITLLPNGSRQIDVQADYIYYRAGSAGGADTTIAFRPLTGGETVYLKPGQAYKLPQMGDRWTMANVKNEGTIVGTVLMGQGEFIDNTISGSVEVVDGGKARTNAGIAFLASPGKVAVVGEYSYASLWNPAGSGKNLVIETVFVSSTVAGALVLRPQSATIGVQGTNPVSKKIGGGFASVAKIYNGSLAANVDNSIHGANAAANQAIKFEFVEPIIVMPGYGLGACGALNQDVSAVFEYFEEPL